MLHYCLAVSQEPETEAYERSAFREMLENLEHRPHWVLLPRQRAWLEEVYRRVKPIDVSKVPRGRSVNTPEVLKRPLPLKPPPRKKEDDDG